jgi:hypothetical protein
MAMAMVAAWQKLIISLPQLMKTKHTENAVSQVQTNKKHAQSRSWMMYMIEYVCFRLADSGFWSLDL